jgi:hypothetical protein
MLMEKGVNLLSNNLPKVLSPKTHAIIDYAVVAGDSSPSPLSLGRTTGEQPLRRSSAGSGKQRSPC